MSRTLRYLKALADPTRVRLVRILARHELAVNEIVRLLDMGQSRVSRHLAILAQSGLAQARREGLWVYYRVDSGDARPLLEALELVLASDEEQRRVAEADERRALERIAERAATSRQFFDARAGDWDRLSREVLGGVDVGALVREMLHALGPRPRVALDIGCGTGAILDVLAAGASSAIGVDSSPRMLERARRRFQGRPGIELRLGEAEHLPLGDGEADVAVMSMALHHLAEPEAGLREVSRVTSEGGVFLLVDLARHEREELRETQGDRWLGFDRAGLKAMASGVGLTLENERSRELPTGLGLVAYSFRKANQGGKRNGQRNRVRGS